MFSIKPNGDSSVPVTGSVSDPVALPLSAGQLGVWFAQQLNPSSAAYNIGEYIEIDGPIDPVLFEQALRQVIIESEALCVRFVEQADGPRQFVGTPPDWLLTYLDLSGTADARAEAEAWMRFDLAQPVNPLLGPTFAFALFKLSTDRFFWYARYHHIVMDGLGMALVARRVADVYTKLSVGPAALGGAFGALSDVLNDETGYRTSERFERDRRFWLNRLADRPERVSLGGPWTGNFDRFIRHTAFVTRAEVERLRTGRTPGGRAPSAFACRRHRGLSASHERRGGSCVRAAGRSPQRRGAQHARHGVQRSAAAARNQFPDVDR